MIALPVAVQINLFPTDKGILAVPFSKCDEESSTEIARFIIPWHELHGLIDRMESIERGKLDVDSGISPF